MKQPNRLKAAIREGRLARGYNLTFPSVHVIEILAPFDFDFVWLDGEHGPFGLNDLEEHCRAAESVGVTPIARVPNIQPSTILQFLDRGVQGIMGPHIATRADAEQLVKACLFGPQGERSFGGNRGCDYDFELQDKAAYYRRCNDNMVVAALLEDGGVVENLDEILQVPGIDYFSVGPNDFAQGLGYPGEPGRPDVVDAIEAVHARIRAAGQRVGDDVARAEWVKQMLIDSARRFTE
jgi:2-keto-3-deoxy-L-rhamnonate aldolase RhmA